jgi:hypothetical protein
MPDGQASAFQFVAGNQVALPGKRYAITRDLRAGFNISATGIFRTGCIVSATPVGPSW